jgi:hypothetical protein
MAQTKKYYLKNNYLTLRSKVKVPRRSLRYATHCLMVMHPHTTYILFKTQLVDLEVKAQGPTKVITVRDTPPYGHAPTYQISLTKTICLPSLCNTSHFNVIFKKKIHTGVTSGAGTDYPS